MANECVPFFKPGSDITGKVTTGTVTGKRFVMVDTAQTGANAWAPVGLKATPDANVPRVKQATAGARAIGVSQRDAANGKLVGILGNGVVPVTSGAAVTPGQEVESDANGKAIPLNTGKAIGLALSHATAADLDLAVQLY